jgi:flavodoxin
MKALVAYDSIYGNTKKVADAIATGLGSGTRAVAVTAISEADLVGIEMLVAGCPINGWRPSAGMGKFLGTLHADQLRGIKAAAFDTRVRTFFHGDAAGKVAKALSKAGAETAAPPCLFLVEGKEGPLAAGELERAEAWGRSLAGTPVAG